jgi:hypothetical protein
MGLHLPRECECFPIQSGTCWELTGRFHRSNKPLTTSPHGVTAKGSTPVDDPEAETIYAPSISANLTSARTDRAVHDQKREGYVSLSELEMFGISLPFEVLHKMAVDYRGMTPMERFVLETCKVTGQTEMAHEHPVPTSVAATDGSGRGDTV